MEESIMRQSPKDLEGSARIGAAKIRKALDDLMEWKKAHHGKMSADETLLHLFNTLVTNLFELKDAKSSDEDRFAYGQKTAYVEVLEILQEWEDAVIHGLDFDVEKVFPLYGLA